ncbi:MAG: DUF1015 family protein [Actinomycetota bacterium]
MPTISPFRAIRYRDGIDLSLVTAPPYDVIGPDEAVLLRNLHPENVIHLTLGGDFVPAEPSPSGDDKYTMAGGLFRNWLGTGTLVKDLDDAFFVYSIAYTHAGREHQTVGLVAALELEPFGEKDVLPHENTTPGPKKDRLSLMRATGANLEPLWFFTSKTISGWGELVGRTLELPPTGRATDAMGMVHSTWRIDPDTAAPIVDQMGSMPIVMGDGHHRYETALAYRDERRLQDGAGPWDAAMVLISDAARYGPTVLPTHRIARGVDLSSFEGLQEFDGSLEDLERAVAEAGAGTIGVADSQGRWTMKSTGLLDTAFVADQILEPQGAEVVYEHDLGRISAGIDSGAAAFLLAPVSLDLVADEAVAGRRTPPKTTLFWPKPRSGFVMRDLEPEPIP